jgi:hypothetical protein
LCQHMNNNKFRTYNTMSLTAGNRIYFPNFNNSTYDAYGLKKGWQMKKGAEMFGINPSSTFLFDDNQSVILAAKTKNPHGTFVYVNNNIPDHTLNIKMVKSIVV